MKKTPKGRLYCHGWPVLQHLGGEAGRIIFSVLVAVTSMQNLGVKPGNFLNTAQRKIPALLHLAWQTKTKMPVESMIPGQRKAGIKAAEWKEGEKEKSRIVKKKQRGVGGSSGEGGWRGKMVQKREQWSLGLVTCGLLPNFWPWAITWSITFYLSFLCVRSVWRWTIMLSKWFLCSTECSEAISLPQT